MRKNVVMSSRAATRISLAAVLTTLLAGCSHPPELPRREPDALTGAAYPQLVPIERILGTAAPDPEQHTQRSDRLEARVANLKARARGLQGASDLDSETRARLNRHKETD